MKYIFQNFEGNITELNGCVCEVLLCIQNSDEKLTTSGVFWLKVRDGNWHRFFLDSNYYFLVWTEQDNIDKSEIEDEGYSVIEIAEKYNFKNCKISEIEIKQIQNEIELVGCLTICFSEGRLLEIIQGSESASMNIFSS